MTRLLSTLAVLALLPAWAFAQCTDLAPIDDGSGAFGAVGLPPLVISEVNHGDYIELFNTTGSDIVFPGVYQLCSMFQYISWAGTIPAHGYMTVPWPAQFSNATQADGEMMLYKSGNFGVNTDILDYVVWGNPAFSRKSQALAVAKWVGINVASPTNGAIHRKVGVKGTSVADYDNAAPPSPENCSPPTHIGDTPALLGARIWNSPNPFGSHTNVEFLLDQSANVDLAIYAVDGSLVRTLAKQSFPAGVNRVAWDGTDDAGRRVASGTYLARMTGGVSAAARITLVR